MSLPPGAEEVILLLLLLIVLSACVWTGFRPRRRWLRRVRTEGNVRTYEWDGLPGHFERGKYVE